MGGLQVRTSQGRKYQDDRLQELQDAGSMVQVLLVSGRTVEGRIAGFDEYFITLRDPEKAESALLNKVSICAMRCLAGKGARRRDEPASNGSRTADTA